MAGPIREVPAVGRALDLLDVFLDGKGPRSVPEITAELGLPRSTTYELVQTLVMRKCLRAIPGHEHRYDLGLHLFELGSAYADSVDITEQAQQVARDVVARVDETVHVATLDGTDVVYLVKADSSQAVRMVSAVGRRLAAHCTAVGKAILSGLDDRQVAERYAGMTEWVRMTPNTIGTLDDLLAALAQVRERGIAFDDCESNVDVRCVAAPVRDATGEVVAGVSISVPVHRADPMPDEVTECAIGAARSLSARLGYRTRTGGR